MILDNYDHQMGKSCRTVALRNLMARNGLEWKEDFLFGLANGFNFSFALPSKSAESKYLKCLSPNLFQFENFAENMGLEYQVITQVDSGYQIIEQILRFDDNPVLCEVSPEKYKKHLQVEGKFWDNLKLDVPVTSHITEVIGIEDGDVYFCENYSREVFHVSKKIFSKARNIKTDSYLNPHHKIHYFMIPDGFERVNMKTVIKKSIKRNIRSYCDESNQRLGKRAFDLFIESFPHIYEKYGERLCKKSLLITGSLIKYVSPGMFRKVYARFLEESANEIGEGSDINAIVNLLKKSDFLWNKYAAHLLNNGISVCERMNGEKTAALLKQIKHAETEAVERMVEISESW